MRRVRFENIAGAAMASRIIYKTSPGRVGRALALWALLGAAMVTVGGCGDGDDDSSTTASGGGGAGGGGGGTGGGGGGGGGPTTSWSVSGTPPSQTMAGAPFTFAPTVANPNNAALTFTYSNLPGWLSANASTGAITGTPGAGDVNTYSNIQLTVSDGASTYTSPAYSIQVVATALGSVTLSWTPPTTYTDGAPLPNPTYRVYFGTAQGSFTNMRPVPSGLARFVVDQLTPGTYYFVVTALDAGGVESPSSNVASKVVN